MEGTQNKGSDPKANEFNSDQAVMVVTLIGTFITHFSAIEQILASTIHVYLNKNDQKTLDAITGYYDFSTLAKIFKVTCAAMLQDSAKIQSAETLSKKCIELANNYRNPIVHASWGFEKNDLLPTHFSRNSGEYKRDLASISKIQEAVLKANDLMNEMTSFFNSILPDIIKHHETEHNRLTALLQTTDKKA